MNMPSTRPHPSHLEVQPEGLSRDGDGATGMAENSPTNTAVVTTNKHTELDVTVGTLLASFVWHPVLPQIRVSVLGEEKMLQHEVSYPNTLRLSCVWI